jgi:hypothetical protein
MSWWMETDPLCGIACRWSESRAAPRYAAGVLAILGVLTAIQQSILGLGLLRQLPDSAQPLAYFTFGVTVLFTALSPFLVLLVFSALLCAAARLFRVSCDLRSVILQGGIAHLPIALWAAVTTAVIAIWPPDLNLQEVLARRAALEFTWQFDFIFALRLVAYLWSIVLFTTVWSRTWTNETWRGVAAVVVATTTCLAAGGGLSHLLGS